MLITSQHHDISDKTTRCCPSYAFGLSRANPRASAPSPLVFFESLQLATKEHDKCDTDVHKARLTMTETTATATTTAATHGNSNHVNDKKATTPAITGTTTTLKRTADGGNADNDNNNDDVFNDNNPTRMMGSRWAASGR